MQLNTVYLTYQLKLRSPLLLLGRDKTAYFCGRISQECGLKGLIQGDPDECRDLFCLQGDGTVYPVEYERKIMMEMRGFGLCGVLGDGMCIDM